VQQITITKVSQNYWSLAYISRLECTLRTCIKSHEKLRASRASRNVRLSSRIRSIATFKVTRCWNYLRFILQTVTCLKSCIFHGFYETSKTQRQNRRHLNTSHLYSGIGQLWQEERKRETYRKIYIASSCTARPRKILLI